MASATSMWVALSLVACSGEPERDRGEQDAGAATAVEVSGIGVDETSHVPVILLEELGGGRILPIWIGSSEARSIASEIGEAESPRPNSHDLMKRLLSGLGAKVLRATVTELRGNTYYAVLEVEASDRVHEFDARPSDAIAVALRFDAPLFVSSKLFESRSSAPDDTEPRTPSEDPDEDRLQL